MPAWPAIPFFTYPSAYSETGPQENVLRTPMSKGKVKTRRRFTAAPRIIRGETPVLSDAQVDTFVDWFSNTIGDGALDFTATHPRTQVTATFRFVKTYDLIHIMDNKWRVRGELEVLI